MRTTLKRGTGGPETNGRAQSGPLASPLSPVSRYRGHKPGPFRVMAKILTWVVIVLLMAAGALAGGAWLFINESVSAIRAHTPEAREAQKILDVPAPGEPTVAIVIGYDQRQGVDADTPPRSDTIMLLRADPQQDTISMLSFPRDLVVEIPACEGNSPRTGRINEVFTACGPKGTLETVRDLTGVPINYMVTVNFQGFKDIVDEVGGVYVDVDRRYFNDNAFTTETYAEIDLRPGYQKLSGGKALDFVRFRHTDSDFHRIRRQQEFVKSFKQRISGFVALTKLPGIVNAITENVEVGVGGNQPLDLGTVYGYAKLAYELPSGSFSQIQVEPEQFTGFAELAVADEAIQHAVAQFQTPDLKAAEKAANVATGRGGGNAAPLPSQVSIEVLNGNGVAGSADEAGFLLGRRGYQVVHGGNADAFNYFRTQVLFDGNQKGSKKAADEVARLFGDGEVKKAEGGLPVLVRVVVGQTFAGSLGPGAIDDTPAKQPPKTTKDSGEARELIARAQRRVDFPLMVPTVREQNSRLSSGGTSPLRTYKIEGHDAIRLTYTLNDFEYWGIQQTSWTEAPILKEPSTVRKIKGRDYRLYFNGSRLHMVSFQENDSAYWVVNTVLDKLSNETMLAIAKGLKPLNSG